MVSSNLFGTATSVTLCRMWTTVNWGVIGHRNDRCLSNVDVSFAIASFPGLVYMASVRGSWCRLLAWRRMVDAPFSPRWVSEEWRSWWSVNPPLACLKMVEARS